ncbi:MAG TPA: hypothetical protein VGF06_05915 [Terriglobales bacterium]|jgi:hypothetical protein
MKKSALLLMLGLGAALLLAAPSKANAQVFIGVHIGPVAPRPAYVVVHPRPYPRVYYRPRAVVAPVYVRPAPRFYYRERWYPRPVVYRRYVAPGCFRR